MSEGKSPSQVGNPAPRAPLTRGMNLYDRVEEARIRRQAVIAARSHIGKSDNSSSASEVGGKPSVISEKVSPESECSNDVSRNVELKKLGEAAAATLLAPEATDVFETTPPDQRSRRGALGFVLLMFLGFCAGAYYVARPDAVAAAVEMFIPTLSSEFLELGSLWPGEVSNKSDNLH